MEEIQKFIQQHIHALTWQEEHAGLYDPIDYMLASGGKRIRPCLCLLSAELFGGSKENAIYPAIAFEMLHNFTLIHDDIMDKALLRRGKESVYTKWNTNTAILSGDTLFAESYRYLLRYQGTELLTLISLLTDTAIEICEGQQWDMDFEHRNDVTINQYIDMIRLKTSVMLAACLKAGAVTASASEENRQRIYDFGIQIGLAFQIRDDMLDVYADVAKFGKNIGGDIAENKKTYLSLQAMHLAQGEDFDRLRYCFSSFDGTKEEKFIAVKSVYDKYNLKHHAQDRINSYYEEAFLLLDQIDVDQQHKQPLIDFVNQLIDRDS
ncbi:MAG: polyprenyl synthetase family protein [Bacteroidales bacterium]|jgi:geranylgeranyl diphosphate synthase type II|nr:polyprenyl synthetase family protein [Bacteroidales bacterium]